MSRIDPSYVSEEGGEVENGGGENSFVPGDGFTVGNKTYFKGKDIYKSEYTEPGDFEEMVRLINDIQKNPKDYLDEVTKMQNGIDKRNEDLNTKIAYAIKYTVWGIYGNLNNQSRKEINESVNDNEFNLGAYDNETEFSTEINNYEEMLKIYLSTFLIDLLVDEYVYANNGNTIETYDINNKSKYENFEYGLGELMDIQNDSEKHILYLLCTNFVKNTNIYADFEKLINNIKTVGPKVLDFSETNAFITKKMWPNFVDFVNNWISSGYYNDKPNNNETQTYNVTEKDSAVFSSVFDSLKLILDKTDKNLLFFDKKRGLIENANVLMMLVNAFLGADSDNEKAGKRKALIRNFTKFKLYKPLENIKRFLKIYDGLLNGYVNTKNTLSRIVKSYDYFCNSIEAFIDNVGTEMPNLSELETVCNNTDLKQIENDFTAILNHSNTQPRQKTLEKEKKDINLFDLLSDNDFYILGRGALGNIQSRIIELLEKFKTIGNNSLRFSYGNMTPSSRIYAYQLRNVFANDKFRLLRSYLYYITNKDNYSDELRSLLYGDSVLKSNNINSPNFDLLDVDDPCNKSNIKTSTEIYEEIRQTLLRVFSGLNTDKQLEIVSNIKSWLINLKQYGRNPRSSSSKYEHIQDTLQSIIKNGDMQDKIRAANVLQKDSRDVLRSLELVFSRKSDVYNAIKEIPPKDILENKEFNFIVSVSDGGDSFIKICKAMGLDTSDPKNIIGSLPDSYTLLLYDENGQPVDKAHIVDLLYGSHKSINYEDKDKTNAEIAAYCNEIAWDYSVLMSEQDKDINNPSIIYSKLSFKREINRPGKQYPRFEDKEMMRKLGKLSIDVGNENCGIAVEYQGEQHYAADGKNSPIQEKVRCAEFTDGKRLKAYFDRRNKYFDFIISNANSRGKSMNKLSDDFLVGIILEFKNALENTKTGNVAVDSYGVPINEKIEKQPDGKIIDTIKPWLLYLNGQKKKKSDLDLQKITGADKANSIGRWEAEIQSWYQMLKDKTKVEKLCSEKNITVDDLGNSVDKTWLFIHLIPKKYQEFLPLITDTENPKTIFTSLKDKIRQSELGVKLSDKEMRSFVRKCLFCAYYDLDSYDKSYKSNYYAYIDSDRNNDSGDFNRASYGSNFKIFSWPGQKQNLRDEILERYNTKWSKIKNTLMFKPEEDQQQKQMQTDNQSETTLFETIITDLMKELF